MYYVMLNILGATINKCHKKCWCIYCVMFKILVWGPNSYVTKSTKSSQKYD